MKYLSHASNEQMRKPKKLECLRQRSSHRVTGLMLMPSHSSVRLWSA